MFTSPSREEFDAMNDSQFDAFWEAAVEAAAQAVVDGKGSEDEVEAIMVAQGEAFCERMN